MKSGESAKVGWQAMIKKQKPENMCFKQRLWKDGFWEYSKHGLT